MEANRLHILVGQRQVEAVAEGAQRFGVEFLLLVRAHLALPRLAHAVAFLGLGKDHRRAPLVVRGGCIGGEDLHRIVTATAQAVDVRVGHVRDQCLQIRVFVEEMLAIEPPVGGGVGLEFAVDGFVQALEQHAFLVARKEPVPVRPPEELHHVPARAGKQAFEFLDDRAVAAHRAVEPLQVAVHDKDQVVEPFAYGEREPGERFRLVHLAIADEGPDLAIDGIQQPAVCEVTHEARLVDRVDRAQAHRPGGELPEVRHQPGVGIRRKPATARLAPVAVQLRLAQAPLEKGSRIDPGGRVRLEVDKVTGLPGTEEVVEPDLEEVRGRRIACDMAAQFGVGPVGAHHHGKRVPAHDRAQALLDVEIPRELRLVRELHAVAVGRVHHRRHGHAARTRVLEQLPEEEGCALAPFGRNKRIEGVEPFAGFGGVDVRRVYAPERGRNDVREVGHACSLSGGPPQMVLFWVLKKTF